MIKGIQIAILFFLLNGTIFGQQLFDYTQNLIVPGLQNPAFARYNDEINFNLIRKSAFGSFNGAPIDNSFYFSTPLNEKNGIGLSLNQNSQGVFKEINANLQYGRVVNLSDFLRLGFGVSGGVKSQTINLDEIIAFDVDDPFLLNSPSQNTTYDASFGMYLSSSKFLFRISAPQLLGNKYENNFEKLNQHIFSYAQYKLSIKNNLILTPFVGFDYVVNAPINYNAGLMLHYKNIAWIGAQYRSDYSISPMAGISFKNFSISYSYDYTQTNYTNLGLGHEILIQYKINKTVNKIGNISPEVAEDRVFELIDEYFDVQNSDIDLLERRAILKKIKKEINDLIPYLDKERKKQIEKKIKKRDTKKKA